MCEETEKKVFCKKCRAMTPVRFGWEEGERPVKGVLVRFTMNTAYCAECGERVWSGEAEDYNLDAAHAAYRSQEGIVTPDDIRKLMKKYGIGAEALCDVLGWGEATIGRYLNGFLPTKGYSDTLLELLDNEASFYDKVERNRDKITPAAYDKIMKKKAESESRATRSGTAYCIFLGRIEQNPVNLCRVNGDGIAVVISGKSLAAFKKLTEKNKKEGETNHDDKKKAGHATAFKLPIQRYSF